jgi:hypothetical protein
VWSFCLMRECYGVSVCPRCAKVACTTNKEHSCTMFSRRTAMGDMCAPPRPVPALQHDSSDQHCPKLPSVLSTADKLTHHHALATSPAPALASLGQTQNLAHLC